MQAYVALFRGINVGGNNLLPMKELACTLEDAGLADVRTCIQSGNVVFRAPSEPATSLAAQIGDAVERGHGFAPRILVLDRSGFQAAVDANPYPEAVGEPKTLHLTFLSQRPQAPDLATLETLRLPNEHFTLTARVFYLHAPDGIGNSKLAARIERALGVEGTARNWRTVARLQQMLAEMG